MTEHTLNSALDILPLIAIIRGVKPDEILAVASVIQDAGFHIIEVPLNSPNAYESIKIISDAMGDDILIGAGTVLTVGQVEMVKQAGGRLIISPNTNPVVIKHSKKLGLYSVPGFYTPSEAFTAIDAGADALKMFPADTLGVVGYKAMKVILPRDIPVLPVGGVTENNMADYLKAGVAGFGIGSGIYKAGMNIDQIRKNANLLVRGYRQLKIKLSANNLL